MSSFLCLHVCALVIVRIYTGERLQECVLMCLGNVRALEEGVKEVGWVSGTDEADTQQSLAHSLNILRYPPFEDNII